MKTAERKIIVENRWKARRVFDTAINAMPDTITVYNRGGSRDRREVEITETIENLQAIKSLVFNRNTNEHYVAISCDDPKRISYARDTDHKFSSKRRVKTSWQRYIVRNFSDMEFQAKALDMFVFKFQSEMGTKIEYFEEVKGVMLRNYFERGWGGGTCMTGEDNEASIQIYSHNPDIVSLLIYHEPDAPITKGRALLWQTTNGTRFLDRVYPNDGPHIEKFYHYAKKHNMEIRGWNGYPDDAGEDDGGYPYVPVGDDRDTAIALSVRLHKAPNGCMPYMDSFHYGGFDNTNDTVWATTKSDDQCEHIFNCTSGGWSDFPRWSCENCGSMITEHSSENYEGHCHDCYEECCYFNCTRCEEEFTRSERYERTLYQIRWVHGRTPAGRADGRARRRHLGEDLCVTCFDTVNACRVCSRHYNCTNDDPAPANEPTFVLFTEDEEDPQHQLENFVLEHMGSPRIDQMCWNCWAANLDQLGFRITNAGKIALASPTFVADESDEEYQWILQAADCSIFADLAPAHVNP